ncbi:hypothetical protein LF65_00083 [Clostridium beijerinckii]|uniref:Uncharacterized protein n=1 Tax=Clostridium beijerinckii TaxID=1520 RepID=A0A0B5Q3N1_CLOBE|nr:hypothetical protein [Clostridium beijerinckii]AJG96774.1 hypothetical protein LF65_00083 [Clostridium beijerinckii]
MDIKIDSKLSHLTEIEINELMNKYYKNEKASDLVEEYQIHINPSRLYTIFPPQLCENTFCPYCQSQMLIKRPSKSSIYSNNIAYCPTCNHQDYNFCNCNNCSEKRKIYAEIKKMKQLEANKQKKQTIKDFYNLDNYSPININDISFRDRVYLGALLRTSLSEDMSTIFPLENAEIKLAPTPEYSKEILRRLHHNNIILVSPNSNIESFPESNSEIEFPNAYYINKVDYIININFNGDFKAGVSSLMNPLEILQEDKDTGLDIWKEISLEECLEYFKYQLNNVKFDFTVGDKTLATFKDMLESFSTAQIYGIIYRGVANATKYYQESNISRKQAANSVIGSCQRYSERALLEKWDLKKFSRPYDLPQSMISEFLFNRVLKIGSLGFEMPPITL